MLCPNCEAENNEDARFCDECGFPLSGSIARAGGAASPSRAGEQAHRASSAPETFAREYDDHHPSAWSEGYTRRSPYNWQEPLEQPEAGRNDDPFASILDGSDVIEAESGNDVSGGVYDDPLDADARSDYALRGSSDAEDSERDDFEPAFRESFGNKSDFDEFFNDDFDFPEASETAPFTDPLDFGDDFWRDDSTAQMPHMESKPQSNSKSYRIDSGNSDAGKGRIAIIAIGTLVALAAIVAVIGFAFGLWGGKAVPDVTGLTEADAISVLEDNGFTVRTTQVKSDETEGLVLIMDPGAGSLAPEGSEVIIHIATARFIPELEGKSLDEAKAILQEAGYENVRYEVEYTDGEENIVRGVSPEAGTRAKSSMEVVVTYSENYKVPDISGQDLDAAIDAIEDAGLQAEVEYIDSDQYPDGTIIGTRPEAGSKVSQGDLVTITVTRTRGVELVGLTEELLAEGKTITIDGVEWQIESVMSISYQGDDTVSYTATGKPMVSVRGQTLVGSSETIDGTVVWSSDNEVVSIG